MNASRATIDPMPLVPGTRLATRRRAYTHHGIYVGDGRVVHYAGFKRFFRRGPVEEVTLAAFAGGRPWTVVTHPAAPFSRAEVVARARSRLGENAYRLLTNNCEHFCEWCTSGRHRSAQVESFFAGLLPRLLRSCLAAPRASAVAGARA